MGRRSQEAGGGLSGNDGLACRDIKAESIGIIDRAHHGAANPPRLQSVLADLSVAHHCSIRRDRANKQVRGWPTDCGRRSRRELGSDADASSGVIRAHDQAFGAHLQIKVAVADKHEPGEALPQHS
eukprot:scaffold147731_cov28-Tisochrysis_lutea.AAC.5